MIWVIEKEVVIMEDSMNTKKQNSLVEALDNYRKYSKYKRVNHDGISDKQAAYEQREEKRNKELLKAKKELDTIFKKEIPLNSDFKITNLYNEKRTRDHQKSSKEFLNYCYENGLLDIHLYTIKPPKDDSIHQNDKLGMINRREKLKVYAREDDGIIQNLAIFIEFLQNKLCFVSKYKTLNKVNLKHQYTSHDARAYSPDLKLIIQPITQDIDTFLITLIQKEHICIVSECDNKGKIFVYLIYCNSQINDLFRIYDRNFRSQEI